MAALQSGLVYGAENAARFRFACGTLPGHLESGEVSISVERREGGEVVARIDSFSRTVDPLAQAAAPLTRLIQKRFTNGYLEALDSASQPPK